MSVPRAGEDEQKAVFRESYYSGMVEEPQRQTDREITKKNPTIRPFKARSGISFRFFNRQKVTTLLYFLPQSVSLSGSVPGLLGGYEPLFTQRSPWKFMILKRSLMGTWIIINTCNRNDWPPVQIRFIVGMYRLSAVCDEHIEQKPLE